MSRTHPCSSLWSHPLSAPTIAGGGAYLVEELLTLQNLTGLYQVLATEPGDVPSALGLVVRRRQDRNDVAGTLVERAVHDLERTHVVTVPRSASIRPHARPS